MSNPKQYYKDVHILSSRKPDRVIRLQSDAEICDIEALRAVDRSLPPPELGERVELKVYFG